MTSLEPDFKKCVTKANEILLRSTTINTFPFSVNNLIEEYPNIKLYSFTEFRDKGGDPTSIGSEDASIIQYGKYFLILYNDKHVMTRVKFSVIHELGHYILNHQLDIKGNQTLYDKQEIETNFFTAQLLMPEQIIKELIIRKNEISEAYLKNIFGVSKEASQKRIRTLRQNNFLQRNIGDLELDDLIVYKFSEFLEKVSPKKTFERSDYIEDEMILEEERSKWY